VLVPCAREEHRAREGIPARDLGAQRVPDRGGFTVRRVVLQLSLFVTPDATAGTPSELWAAGTHGICRQGLTRMTASRAAKRALLKIAIRMPNQQPAGSRSDNSRRTRSSPNQEGTPHRHDGVMRPFEQASLVEFVRRADGPPEAGVCTHQGCQAVFRPSDDRLRCPCHGPSFSPTGQLHPGPTALAPLPRLEIRDVNVAIEVFGPAEPTCWPGCQPGVTRIPTYVVSTHGNGTAISIPTSQMRGLWPASSGLVASSDDNHARIEQP